MKKDITSLLDLTRYDIDALIQRAMDLKRIHKEKGTEPVLAGKTLGLLFDKPSTRTRLSFETAMVHLGGTPIYISSDTTQMSRNEPTKDTARVLSRYLDALAIRTFSQDLLEQFAAHADIPVINALTDMYHPCQILSDMMTVVESKGDLEKLTIGWVGDGNNMAQSWINAASVMGFKLVLACPENFAPDAGILKRAQDSGRGKIVLTTDPVMAVTDAQVINTDVWASMGQDDQLEARKKKFEAYQLNETLLAKAPKDVIVLHCLPAHRGEEITEAVLEGKNSAVWEQSENKMHMHKAILETLIGK